MGGELVAESEIGRGSVFTVMLRRVSETREGLGKEGLGTSADGIVSP